MSCSDSSAATPLAANAGANAPLPVPLEGRAGPLWRPPGGECDRLPAELQAAVASVMQPAWDELVGGASGALARSTGVTICNLLWLELIDQLRLARVPREQRHLGVEELLDEPRRFVLERHLRTVGAKLKATDLLIRIENAAMKVSRDAPAERETCGRLRHSDR